MGDSRRFIVTRDFILRNYPGARSILCVADGKGDLADLLKKEGRNAQVIDPVYNGLYFTRKWKHNCDLIVGLHPDEATAEIVMVGERLKIPYLIVPCCVKGPEAERMRDCFNKRFYENHTDKFTQWCKHLQKLSLNTLRETTLPMRGQNLILFK